MIRARTYLLTTTGICLILLLTITIIAAIGLASMRYATDTYDDYWRGRARQPGSIVYVALGDSTAVGIGASRPERGYVGLLADEIGRTTGLRVQVINLARGGATARDVLNEQVPRLNRIDADLVTLSVGANDVVHDVTVADYRRDLEAIIQALPPGRSTVADAPYFNGRIRKDDTAQAFNPVVTTLTRQYGIPRTALYAKLRQQQNISHFAVDIFHPNDRGYRLWADAFRQHVQPLSRQAAQRKTAPPAVPPASPADSLPGKPPRTPPI